MTDPRAAQTELVARLHGLLGDEPTTRVIPMFGSRAFMVRNKMVCCALKGGHLLAHVDPDDDAKLSGEPGPRSFKSSSAMTNPSVVLAITLSRAMPVSVIFFPYSKKQ